jgi:hypothetical protein
MWAILLVIGPIFLLFTYALWIVTRKWLSDCRKQRDWIAFRDRDRTREAPPAEPVDVARGIYRRGDELIFAPGGKSNGQEEG